MIDKVATSKMAVGDSMIVGSLSPEVVEALADAGIEPETAAIVARDQQVLHALRDAKPDSTPSGLAKAVTADELALLPTVLQSPRAVLLSPGDKTLIYVFDADRREAGKIIVQVNYVAKLPDETGKRVKQQVNDFRSASLIDLADLAKDVASGDLLLISGEL